MRRRAEPLAIVLAIALAPGVQADLVNRVVLRVNDQIATQRDYDERKRERVEQITQSSDLGLEDRRRLVAEAGRATMKELFEELLVLSRAHQLHLETTPAQVDRAVENAKRHYGIESDADFEQALTQSGTTLAEFRARMSKNLVFNEVFEREVQSKIQIDDEAVARYWHDHAEEFRRPEARRIEEIVVREESALAPEARAALARDIAARAGAGATLADAAGAAAAGDAVSDVIEHDWVERGTLAAELESTAFALPAPGVCAPVEGRGGLHVLRVVEIRAAASRPLEEVKEDIRAKLGQTRFEEHVRQLLDELAGAAYIVEDLPEEAAGYRSAPGGAADPLRDLLRGPGAAAPKTAPPAAPAATPPPAGGS